MIDTSKLCVGTLLVLASMASPLAAQQRVAAESITYRAQNGVLDATDQDRAESVVSSQHAASSAAHGSGKPSAEPGPGSTANSGFSGDTPFPGAAKIDDSVEKSKGSSTGPLVTVTSSLAIVLGLFAGLVWLLRRSGGKATGQLPEEVFSLLGRTTLGPRQNIMLARCGRRILVLAVSPNTTSTLAEITDPDEVADLAAQCGNGGSRQLFQRTLTEMGEQEPTVPGFIDPADERPTRGLFVNG